MLVPDKDLENLWNQHRIAIHFPGEKSLNSFEAPDLRTLDREKYGDERKAIDRFLELGREGGYIWAETRVAKDAMIGKVLSGTDPKFYEAEWEARHKGKKAWLKTLRLESVKPVPLNKLRALRAQAPTRGTISPWKNVGDLLERLVEGKDIQPKWNLLLTDTQETLCSEFLREGVIEGRAKLANLLLPVGRTMEDIDIYGIDSEGRRVIGQVTNYGEGPNLDKKIRELAKYGQNGAQLYMFCDVSETREKGKVLLVPTKLVEKWSEGDGLLHKALKEEYHLL
jgi:hypothetical protein